METKKPTAPFADKKIVLINRDFQLRFTIIAVFLGIISTIFTAVTILYPLYAFEILRIPRFLPPPVLFSMILAMLLNISAIAFFGIFITHRIAGPMFSLVRRLRFGEEGQYRGHVFLRQGDELNYLARNMNAFFDSLVQRTEEDRAKIKVVIDQLSSKDPSYVTETCVKSLKELERDLSDRVAQK